MEIDNPGRKSMAESLRIDVKQDDDNGSEKADDFNQKVNARTRIPCFKDNSCEL